MNAAHDERLKKGRATRIDIVPDAAMEDCCITAAHRAEAMFRRRQLTPEERKEVEREMEKLREQLGLPAKKDSV